MVTPKNENYIGTALGVQMPAVKSDNEYRRAGIEIQLGWRDNIGDLKYDIAANYTYYNTMWALRVDEDPTSSKNPYKRGQQVKENYYGNLYKSLGYYESAQDVYNSAGFVNSFNSGYLTAGDLKYQDVNGDGKLDSEDTRRMGKASSPHGQFGISINLNYKGFYFSTLFQGSTSFNRMVEGKYAMQTGQTGAMVVAYDYQTDYWTPDNRNAQYPRLMSNSSLNADNNFSYSDFWLFDSSFIRMKDFQFGYDFKYKLLKNVNWLTRCKVGISGQNIFTISEATKYGIDPESNGSGYDNYPVERTLAFTLNLGF